MLIDAVLVWRELKLPVAKWMVLAWARSLVEERPSRSAPCSQKRTRLSNEIVTLARSLGFYTTIDETTKTCQSGQKGKYWRIHISVDQQLCPVIPVKLDRKRFDASCKEE